MGGGKRRQWVEGGRLDENRDQEGGGEYRQAPFEGTVGSLAAGKIQAAVAMSAKTDSYRFGDGVSDSTDGKSEERVFTKQRERADAAGRSSQEWDEDCLLYTSPSPRDRG